MEEANQVQAEDDAGTSTKWWLTIPGWLAMGLGALLYAEVVAASVEAAHNVLEGQHPAWVFAAILVGWPLLVLGGWASMWRRSSQRRQVSARSPSQITRYGFGLLLLALIVMVLFVVSTFAGM